MASKLDTAVLNMVIEAGSVGKLPKRIWTKKQAQSLVWSIDQLRLKRRFGTWGACNYPNDPFASFKDGDWRGYFAELLRARGMHQVDLWQYNPDKGAHWTSFDAFEEDMMKSLVWAHAFFIGRLNRSTVSISELLAAMLYGWNVFPVIELMTYGQVLEGQEVTQIERRTLNDMRLFVQEVAEAIGVTVFKNLDEMAEAFPIDEADMAVDRFHEVDSVQRSAVKSVLKHWQMDCFSSDSVIEISNNPFLAQLDVLGAIAGCLTRVDRVREVTVVLPDVKKWNGVETGGIKVTGRLFKDLSRIVDPYLDTLLARCKAKVRVIRPS